MIGPATGWIEIKDIKTKRADAVSNVITLDRGKEFMAGD